MSAALTDLLLRETPDAVIVTTPDGEVLYALPGMDGLTLTRQIKADETTRHIIVVALTAFAKVDRAMAADQALAHIKEDRPTVILLDLSLPGMDGLNLARQLKADPATRGILIVAITSYPEKFSSAEVLEAGCDAYLHKPISTRTLPETLLAVVENAGGDTDL